MRYKKVSVERKKIIIYLHNYNTEKQYIRENNKKNLSISGEETGEEEIFSGIFGVCMTVLFNEYNNAKIHSTRKHDRSGFVDVDDEACTGYWCIIFIHTHIHTLNMR